MKEHVQKYSRARSLVHKIVRAGYYWPTIQADYKAYIKACDKCQHFNNIPRHIRIPEQNVGNFV